MRIIKVIGMLVVLSTLSACIAPKSYVDNQYKNFSYDGIKKISSAHPAKIEVQFQRNGKHFGQVDPQLRLVVENTFRKSGVVVASQSSPLIITVKVNNLADKGNSVKKGIGTGLTLGAVGTQVKDAYEITINMQQKNSQDIQKNYQHAIYTTIGRHKAPVDTQPMQPGQAFEKIVEDVILKFINDMQQRNLLSFKNILPNTNIA